MKDKLVLPVVKPLSQKNGTKVRAVVSDATLRELNAISDRTGIYISQLARMCIEFALPRIVIRESEDE